MANQPVTIVKIFVIARGHAAPSVSGSSVRVMKDGGGVLAIGIERAKFIESKRKSEAASTYVRLAIFPAGEPDSTTSNAEIIQMYINL